MSGSSKTITGTMTIPSLTISGTVTNNGTLTVSTALAGAGTLTNGNSATLNVAGTTPISGGTLTASGTSNTVNYTSAGQTCKTTSYVNLTVSGSGTFTCATTSVTGNLAMSGTESWTTGAGLTIGGTTTVGDGTSLILGAYTFESDGNMTVGGGSTGIFTATSGTGITLKGNLVLNAGATWTKMSSGTVTFNKAAAQTLTDSTASLQDLGAVSVATASTNLQLGSNVKLTSLTTAASTTFTPGANTLTILGSGSGGSRPFINGGTFTTGTSTIDYEGSSATDIETTNVTYNNLNLDTTSNTNSAVTYTLNGNETMAGVITVGNSGSTNAATLGLSSYTLILSNTGTPLALAGSSKGLLSGGTSIVEYTGNGATSTAGSYYNLQLTPGGSTQITMGSGTYIIGGALTIGNGTNNGATAATNNPIINVTGAVTIATGATYTTGGGAVSLSGGLTVSGTMSGSGSGNITVSGGDITGTGTINISGNTFTHALQTFSRNFGTTSGSNNWSFNNLTFQGSSGTATLQGGTGTITVGGTLTISSGDTLNLGSGSRTVILSNNGTPFSISGIFTPNTGTIQYTGSTDNVAATTYNNLTLGGTGTYTLPASDITLRGNLLVTSGATVTKNASHKIIFASGNGSQTLTDNTSGQDLGAIEISANSGATTLTLGSSATVTSITTDASQTFVPSSYTLTITGTGTGGSRPFINNGIFTRGSSTIDYEGQTGATDVETTNVSYDNLNLGTTSDSTTGVTYTLNGNETISGIITVGNSGSTNADTLALGSTTLIFNGANLVLASSSKGLLSSGTSTVEFLALGGSINSAVQAATYNNLMVMPAAGMTAVALGAGTFNVNGNLTIGNGTSGGATAATNNPIINVTGTTTIAAGATYTTGNGAVGLTGDLTVNGTLSGSGTGNISASGNVAGTGTINISGNTFTQSLGSSSLNFGTTSGSNNWSFNNLTFSGSSGTAILQGGSGTITASGTLTISSGATFDLGSGSRTVVLAGFGTPFVISGTFAPDTGTIQYSGSSTIVATTYNGLTLSGTETLPASDVTILGNFDSGSGTVTKSSSNKLIFAIGGGGTQTLNGGSSDLGIVEVSANSGNTTLSLSGSTTVTSIIIDSSQTLSPPGLGTVTITGSGSGSSRPFINNGSAISSLSADYEGTSATDVETTNVTYNNLTVGGNSGGAVVYTPNGNPTVSGQLVVGSLSGSTHTFDITSKTLTLSAGRFPLTIGTYGALNTTGSTVLFNSLGGSSLVIPALTYNNLEIEPTSLLGVGLPDVFGGGTFTINGDLTMGDGTHAGADTTTNCPTINVSGTTTVSANATYGVACGLSALNTDNLVDNGVITKVSSGTGSITATGNVTGTGSIDLSATAVGSFTIDASSATNFGPSGSAPINNWKFKNLTFNSSPSSTITVVTPTSGAQIEVTNTLTIGSGTTLDMGTGSQTLTLDGSSPWSNSGTFLADTSTVVMNGSTQTVPTETFNNLTLSTGTYTLPASDITLRGNLNVNGSATITKSSSNKIIFAKGGGGTATLTTNGNSSDLGLLEVSANSGNTELDLSGNMTAEGITIDSSQTFVTGANTLTLLSTTPMTVNGTLTATSGSTVNFVPSSGPITIPSATYYNVGLQGNYTFTAGAGTLTMNNLVMNTSTPTLDLNTNNPTVTINGDVTSAGTISASGTNALTLKGNYTNSGTFTANSGTVVLAPTPTSVTLNGGLTFYNLTDTTPANRINITAGQTLAIGNQLNFTGSNSNPIQFGSSSPGSQWYVDFTSITNGLMQFVQLFDAGCAGGTDNFSGYGDSFFNMSNNGSCWNFVSHGGGTSVGVSAAGNGSGGGSPQGGGGQGLGGGQGGGTEGGGGGGGSGQGGGGQGGGGGGGGASP